MANKIYFISNKIRFNTLSRVAELIWNIGDTIRMDVYLDRVSIYL